MKYSILTSKNTVAKLLSLMFDDFENLCIRSTTLSPVIAARGNKGNDNKTFYYFTIYGTYPS